MRHRRPSFVIILTDDHGYGDLSCMGSADVRTPHLDALAAGGIRFTDWYSNSPVCSPARASLLTGRYPANAGVRSILAGHRTATGLPSSSTTIATALKPLGYRTAMFGKWHLGMEPRCQPHSHGFDHWLGFLAGCVDYYSHIFYWGMNKPGPGVNPTHDLWEDGREVWLNGQYLTEVITRRSVRFIQQCAADDQPFVLYVAYNAPHYPMHAPGQYLDRFGHLPPDRRIMAAMIAAVDDGVGEIMAQLQAANLIDDTCVLFTSDNGPSRESRNWLDGRQDPYYGGAAGGLKGHKFSLYEGGIRVPAVVHWPAGARAGVVCSEMAAHMDVFPTMLAAAGGDPSRYPLDGRDLSALLARGGAGPHQRIFWEMGDQTAVREDKWKLVLNGRLVEGSPPEDAVHLSHLGDDVGERRNLADEQPALTARLRELAEGWRRDIEQRWQQSRARQDSAP
jgi:arylsulfatase A-like enzyme